MFGALVRDLVLGEVKASSETPMKIWPRCSKGFDCTTQ